jgi:hypothetical protein
MNATRQTIRKGSLLSCQARPLPVFIPQCSRSRPSAAPFLLPCRYPRVNSIVFASKRHESRAGTVTGPTKVGHRLVVNRCMDRGQAIWLRLFIVRAKERSKGSLERVTVVGRQQLARVKNFVAFHCIRRVTELSNGFEPFISLFVSASFRYRCFGNVQNDRGSFCGHSVRPPNGAAILRGHDSTTGIVWQSVIGAGRRRRNPSHRLSRVTFHVNYATLCPRDGDSRLFFRCRSHHTRANTLEGRRRVRAGRGQSLHPNQPMHVGIPVFDQRFRIHRQGPPPQHYVPTSMDELP